MSALRASDEALKVLQTLHCPFDKVLHLRLRLRFKNILGISTGYRTSLELLRYGNALPSRILKYQTMYLLRPNSAYWPYLL